MRNLLIFFISLISLLTVFAGTVKAGGGRIIIYTVDTYNNQYPANQEMNIIAQVYKPDSGNSVYSVGERAEFRILNPRPGDVCITRTEKTNEVGVLSADCTVREPGTIVTYVYSFDDGYETSQYPILFVAALPTPTPLPTTQPTSRTAQESIVVTPAITPSPMPATQQQLPAKATFSPIPTTAPFPTSEPLAKDFTDELDEPSENTQSLIDESQETPSKAESELMTIASIVGSVVFLTVIGFVMIINHRRNRSEYFSAESEQDIDK